jgi:hypothetical protein
MYAESKAAWAADGSIGESSHKTFKLAKLDYACGGTS